jgi:release factor glutamine methyltransferase
LAEAGIVPADAEARFIIERASGFDADEWLDIADHEPPVRAAQRVRDMVERRTAGEPLQYVLGAWSFRGLDLMVDARVLIPRPETEMVVEVALEEAQRLGLRREHRRLSLVPSEPSAIVADLGTGSGAIALALEAELPEAEVWATDASSDALAVAQANVAGCAAARVRVAPAGSWFDALPPELRGGLQVIVSNPPYIAEHERASLPDEVVNYEPVQALIAGADGTEMLRYLIDGAHSWLAPSGTLVLELAPHQADAMVGAATRAGYREVFVRNDLADRPRVLVARTG